MPWNPAQPGFLARPPESLVELHLGLLGQQDVEQADLRLPEPKVIPPACPRRRGSRTSSATPRAAVRSRRRPAARGSRRASGPRARWEAAPLDRRRSPRRAARTSRFRTSPRSGSRPPGGRASPRPRHASPPRGRPARPSAGCVRPAPGSRPGGTRSCGGSRPRRVWPRRTARPPGRAAAAVARRARRRSGPAPAARRGRRTQRKAFSLMSQF